MRDKAANPLDEFRGLLVAFAQAHIVPLSTDTAEPRQEVVGIEGVAVRSGALRSDLERLLVRQPCDEGAAGRALVQGEGEADLRPPPPGLHF